MRARAATLGLENVLSRLDERFKLLTVGRRTALPRHQTLRATLDWSYQFMPGNEQKLLRALGVFPAGFTLDAAAGVMNEADDIATDIGNLVAKSLVVMDGSASGRWHLLETTRAYALEKLAEAGEAAAVARLHAMFFRALFSRPEDAAEPRPANARMAIGVREIDNVRTALDWAFAADGDPALGITLTAAFIPVWLHLSLLVECRERITVALAHLQAQANLSARLGMDLHIALGLSLVYTTGLVTRTEEVLGRALALAESLDDLDNQLLALGALWFYHLSSGELRRARTFADQFTVVTRQSGDRTDLALADQMLGYITHFQGSQPEARDYLENVLALQGSLAERPAMLSHPDVRIPVRATLARVLLLQGLVDQAGTLATASLSEELARGRPVPICNVPAVWDLCRCVCHRRPGRSRAGDCATDRCRAKPQFRLLGPDCPVPRRRLADQAGRVCHRHGRPCGPRWPWSRTSRRICWLFSPKAWPRSVYPWRPSQRSTNAWNGRKAPQNGGVMPELLRLKGEVLMDFATSASAVQAEGMFPRCDHAGPPPGCPAVGIAGLPQPLPAANPRRPGARGLRAFGGRLRQIQRRAGDQGFTHGEGPDRCHAERVGRSAGSLGAATEFCHRFRGRPLQSWRGRSEPDSTQQLSASRRL